MSSSIDITLSILFILIFIPMSIGGFSYIAVLGISSPKSQLERIDPKDRTAREVINEFKDWAGTYNFEWVGAYWTRFKINPSICMCCWQHPDGTYFVVYKSNNKKVIDFFSLLDEQLGISLTTGNSPDGESLPDRSGALKQSFPKTQVDGLADLENRFGLEPIKSDQSFEDSFMGFIRAQMKYVRSINLWPVRAVLWFLLRKKFHGQTVSERYAEVAVADLAS